MTQKLYFIIALLCLLAGMTNTAQAADKTVTYTISYTGTNTLTATPNVAGFDGSSAAITGPAISGSNDDFVLHLHDDIDFIVNLYNSSGNHRMYVSNDGITFNFAANITTCCSDYYIKHIAMKDHKGTTITVFDLNDPSQTNFSFDLNVDLDKLGASGAPTTVTEYHVRTANTPPISTTIKTITITYGDSPRSYHIGYTNAVNGENGVTNNNSKASYNVTTSDFNITAPSRTGYDFDGFTYTDAAHTSATATLPMTISRGEAATRKAITFYASWTAHQYTLRLHHNDGSNTYTDMAMTYDVAANLQTITRTGYTFANWSTNADGTGTTYTEGLSVNNLTATQGAIVDLYAQWTANTYTVAFNGNGNTGGNMSNQSFTYDKAQNLTANAFSRAFTVTYAYNEATGGNSEATGTATATFNGWAESAGGEKVYNNSQSVSNLSTENNATVNLFAKWTDGSVILPTPTKTGYTFGGWYPDSELNTSVGAGGASYTPSANITLYAKWTANTYTLCLHHNDGTDAVTNQMLTYDVAANIQSVSRTGYVFAGWSTTPSGSVTYTDGQSVNNLSATQGATIDLYAQWANPTGTCGTSATWEYDHPTTTLTIGGSGAMTGFNADTPWEDYKPYITTVIIGSEITTINGRPFADCTALTTVNGGEALTFVNASAFNNTPWFTAAKSSTAVTYLGKLAFCGTGVSGGVTIAESTVIIAQEAFRDNSTITSVTLPASVTSIGDNAFRDCTALTTVNVLGSTPPTLGSSAFYLSSENRSLSRTFNVRSAAYKTADGWDNIYNKNSDYSGYTGFTMRVVSTLALPDGVTATAAAADKVTAYGTDYYAEGATITLSGLGEEYTTGGVTYRSRATVTYNTDQTLTANADATGQATFTMPATDATVTTEDYAYAVKYIDEDGTEQTCTNFTLIESSDGDVTLGNWQNQENWYVVSGDVTISGRLRFDDKTVHLILCDGAEISVTSNNNGIYIGSSLTIYGQSGQSGILTAQSNSSYDYGINIHNLTVNGGTVNAIGYFGIYCYDITINRGNVTVTGEEYGIRNNGFVTINGGTVSANGTNSWMGIGISDTFDNDDAVTINGGIVSVNGGFCGIDAAGTHINGGIVNATGTRSNGISGHIILGWTSATDRITVSRYGGFVSVKDGQALWTGSGNSALAGNVSQDQRAALAGVELQPLVDALVLHDDDSALPTEQKNTALIVAAAKAGGSRNVVLEGRTFYRDGDWNTLCLPFFIDGDDIQSNAYNPLYGATIMGFSVELYYGPNGKKYIIDNNQYYEVPGYKLADPDPAPLHRSGQVENGKLYLYFEEENSPGGKTYSVNNDVPLILKWGTTDNHPTTDIVNPVFQGVTIPNKYADYGIFGNSLSSFEGPNNVFFQGTFSSTGIYADPAVNLYLGAANTLYWPNTDGYNIGAFRAYFALYNGLTCGGSNSQVRAFNLGFGEGSEETGIISISKESRSQGVAGAWFDLNGRRLSGKPTARGIYVNNGRKVVVK